MQPLRGGAREHHAKRHAKPGEAQGQEVEPRPAHAGIPLDSSHGRGSRTAISDLLAGHLQLEVSSRNGSDTSHMVANTPDLLGLWSGLMRIPKKNLRKEIIALAAHEHAHRFGIWNDAVLIQKFLLDAAEHDNSFGGGLNNFVLPTEFERDRPWNMVKLLNSSLPQLENKITSQDSLGACQNLGYLLGGIVTPFEEGANGDILPPSYYLKVLDLGDSVISANYVCGDVGHDLLIAMGFRPGPYFKPLPKNDLHGVETLIATMKTQQFEIEDFLSAYMSGYRVIGGSPQQYESLLPPSPESPAIVYEY